MIDFNIDFDECTHIIVCIFSQEYTLNIFLFLK